ncbi:RPA-interacting protein A-like [Aricia agestis]|uniref:RPA-interacting protein A-like n=1 Tax=Aricia agestis TaxID=91739 RepID=UPI001C2051B9|nr:RPA-interacting protein A-like [Aricia agestis]
MMSTCRSPSYRNLKTKIGGSPKEIKDKLRKDYKHKIHNSRNLLLNKFRSLADGTDLQQTLTQIYNDTFNLQPSNGEDLYDAEEIGLLEQIKKELIQDELDWWLEEYEKSQMNNIDWSSLQEENVICPICQKNNLNLAAGFLSCKHCIISIKAAVPIGEIKNSIYDCIAKHSSACNSDGHFTVISEDNDMHIYFMCDLCAEMSLVV